MSFSDERKQPHNGRRHQVSFENWLTVRVVFKQFLFFFSVLKNIFVFVVGVCRCSFLAFFHLFMKMLNTKRVDFVTYLLNK